MFIWWRASRRKDLRAIQKFSGGGKVFPDGPDTAIISCSECDDCRSVGSKAVPAAFINKVDEALGEAMETQAWLDHARDAGYLDKRQHLELDETWQKVGAMLNRMIQRADDFCRSASR